VFAGWSSCFQFLDQVNVDGQEVVTLDDRVSDDIKGDLIDDVDGAAGHDVEALRQRLVLPAGPFGAPAEGGKKASVGRVKTLEGDLEDVRFRWGRERFRR
jgi:hypothetical protein